MALKGKKLTEDHKIKVSEGLLRFNRNRRRRAKNFVRGHLVPKYCQLCGKPLDNTYTLR